MKQTPKFQIILIRFYMKFLIYICLTVLLPLIAFSQSHNFIYGKLDNNNGLSQGRVSCILQDDPGFMWFGTRDGLNRYDGYEIKVFVREIDNDQSLSSNRIQCLAKDNEGNLWIGTANGLNKFDYNTESFSRYYFDKDFNVQSNSVIAVIFDEGNIYANTILGGFYKLNIASDKIECLHEPVYSTVNQDETLLSCLAATEKRIWFTTNTYLHYYNKDNHNMQIDSNANLMDISAMYPLSDMKVINDSIFYIASFGNGIFEYNRKSGEIKNLIEVKNINICSESNHFYTFTLYDSIIWAGSHNCGVLRFNLKNYKLSILNNTSVSDYYLPVKNIISIFRDSNGLIWIGTNGYGVYYLAEKTQKFNNYNHILKDFRSNNKLSVRAIYLDKKNNLWVGGYNGLYKIDRDKGDHQIILKDSPVYSIAQNPVNEDILWVGLDGSGLIEYNIETGSFQQFNYMDTKDHPVKGLVFYEILNDSNTVWFASNNGLNKYNALTKNNLLFSYEPENPNSINFGQITCIIKDKLGGGYWIGTDQGGIGFFDGITNNFRRFIYDPENPESISSNNIKCIYQDNNGIIWVGTNEGLNKYNPYSESFTTYTIEDGLPNHVIYGILEDSEKKLWLSTNKGICSYDPVTLKVNSFDISDGLQNNEFNSAAYFESNDGEMFFGGVNGLNSFYPENIIQEDFQPELVFTKLKKFNKEIKLSPGIHSVDKITLDHQDAIFTIEFSAINYLQPQKNFYSYKLSGLESEVNNWINLGKRNFIDFIGLSPGKYKLAVRASNNENIWTDNAKEMTIIITPPFWNTIWFKFILIAFFLLIIFAVFRFRIKNINRQKAKLSKLVDNKTSELKNMNDDLRAEIENRKKTEEKLTIANNTKDKFFSIIGHDLKSPLSSLLGFSEVLNEEYDSFTEEERRLFIRDIYKNTSNLARLTENLLYWSRTQTGKIIVNPEACKLNELIKENIDLFKNQADNKEISIHSNIQQNKTVVFVDENMIKTVFRNMLSNAIKFTDRGGKINILISEKDKSAEIVFEDNGIGMNKETQDNLFKIAKKIKTYGTEKETGTGLGLIISKEFIKFNKGELKIESQEGIGSKFIISLPRAD